MQHSNAVLQGLNFLQALAKVVTAKSDRLEAGLKFKLRVCCCLGLGYFSRSLKRKRHLEKLPLSRSF